MKTGIKKIDDGLNWVDEIELGMAVDGDNHIEDVGELWVGRNGLILAEIYQDLVDPVADAFEGVHLVIVFKDPQL
jgi:hypothetical protein